MFLLQREQYGDVCLFTSCKDDLKKGDLFVLCWAGWCDKCVLVCFFCGVYRWWYVVFDCFATMVVCIVVRVEVGERGFNSR